MVYVTRCHRIEAKPFRLNFAATNKCEVSAFIPFDVLSCFATLPCISRQRKRFIRALHLLSNTMKQTCVFLALLAAVFVRTVDGQTSCSYKTERLALTLNEETCAEACKNCKIASFSSPLRRRDVFSVDSSRLNGPCFAYEYIASREFCEGKVFKLSERTGHVGSDDSYDDGTIDEYYASFYDSTYDDEPSEPSTSCGVNYGVDLTLPTGSNGAAGSESAPEKCRLERIDLGFKANEADCTASCINRKFVRFMFCV